MVTIIPAIDLIGGKCVRLTQGVYDEVEEFSDDPASVAETFYDLGARRLHLVDLEGAKTGSIQNADAIRSITYSVEMETELGGGIRDLETVRYVLEDLGVTRAILGTAALKDPELVERAVDEFGERILVGIDARNGMVATEGWLESSTTPAVELAARLDNLGIGEFIYTDISRDGMLTGPNYEAIRTFAKSVKHPVIASGGISKIDDVRDLLRLQINNLTGIIIGKALYKGQLDLAEAIRIAGE